MKKNFTDITFLLDRSGSMHGTKNDTIGGFNAFLEEQKKVEGEANLTLVQFATNSYTEYTKDIQEVEPLDSITYQPTGSSTAYLDALGKTINETGERLASIPEEERPEKVIFIVMTDGYENSSKEFTKATIKKMIEHQEGVFSWQFVFMGANIDAVAEGSSLGVGASNSMTYAQNSVGIRSSYVALSSNLAGVRKGTLESMSFTDSQRKEQEDAQEEPKPKGMPIARKSF